MFANLGTNAIRHSSDFTATSSCPKTIQTIQIQIRTVEHSIFSRSSYQHDFKNIINVYKKLPTGYLLNATTLCLGPISSLKKQIISHTNAVISCDNCIWNFYVLKLLILIFDQLLECRRDDENFFSTYRIQTKHMRMYLIVT